MRIQIALKKNFLADRIIEVLAADQARTRGYPVCSNKLQKK